MQQICSSYADYVHFTCWDSLTAPAMGQAGAGTARYSAVEGESNPVLAWHDHKLPLEMLWSAWESWPKPRPHVSCGSWPFEDCRVSLRDTCLVKGQKKVFAALCEVTPGLQKALLQLRDSGKVYMWSLLVCFVVQSLECRNKMLRTPLMWRNKILCEALDSNQANHASWF